MHLSLPAMAALAAILALTWVMLKSTQVFFTYAALAFGRAEQATTGSEQLSHSSRGLASIFTAAAIMCFELGSVFWLVISLVAGTSAANGMMLIACKLTCGLVVVAALWLLGAGCKRTSGSSPMTA